MCGMAGVGVLGHSRLAIADLVTQFAVKRTGACRHNRSPQLSASRSPFLDLSALARAEFALGQSLRREQLRSHPLARLPLFLLPEGAGHPGVDVLDFDDGIGHGTRSLQLRPGAFRLRRGEDLGGHVDCGPCRAMPTPTSTANRGPVAQELGRSRSGPFDPAQSAYPGPAIIDPARPNFGQTSVFSAKEAETCRSRLAMALAGRLNPIP